VELRVLMLHGLLHLAGLDHERDNGEMARKERRLRTKLGLPLGLIERVEKTQKHVSIPRGLKPLSKRGSDVRAKARTLQNAKANTLDGAKARILTKVPSRHSIAAASPTRGAAR
jgi:hypothetical protein